LLSRRGATGGIAKERFGGQVKRSGQRSLGRIFYQDWLELAKFILVDLK
jgi:hypothetical protein